MSAVKSNTIAVASDHAGFALKEAVRKYLADKGYDILDLGAKSDERVDYPDYGYAMADAITKREVERGVIVCGSGIGISIAANRNPNVRAALCVTEEMAELARLHNDANVIAFGARIMSEDLALKCLDIFLNTKFEGGRHEQRVKKLGKQ